MGRRPNGEPPKMRRHATGQAFCRAGNKDYYFGVYGTPEARQRYAEFLTEFNRLRGPVVVDTPLSSTIAEAVELFLRDRQRYSPTEMKDVRRDLKRLADKFGSLLPGNFRNRDFLTLRSSFVADGNQPATVNKRAGRVRRFFRWCVAKELCAPAILEALRAIDPVPVDHRNRTEVQPVPLRQLVAGLRVLDPDIRAMAIIQYYAGPRPSEVGRMQQHEIFKSGYVWWRGARIDVPAGVWLFCPGASKADSHPTVHVVYFLGPRCQAVLADRLRPGYLFSPRDKEERRNRKRRAERKSPRTPSQEARGTVGPLRSPGDYYTSDSYARAIERTLKRHGLPHWSPGQLRHNFVARVTAHSDILTASAALGHTSIKTTAIYLQGRLNQVAPIAARVG